LGEEGRGGEGWRSPAAGDSGLAPGSYALEVRQPGLATARVANVVVTSQAETFIPDPLSLTRPKSCDCGRFGASPDR